MRMDRGSLRLERATTVDQVAELIKEAIFAGGLAPGTALREQALAGELRVSRNTMREALRQLEGLGLVSVAAHRGARVAQLTPESVSDLFLVRRVVEGAGVDACRSASAEALGRLEEAMDAMAAAAEPASEAFVERDIEFHARIVGLMGSPRFDALFEPISAQAVFHASVLLRVDPQHDDPGAMVAEHRVICDLLLARSVSKAKRHLLELMTYFETLQLNIVPKLEALDWSSQDAAGS